MWPVLEEYALTDRSAERSDYLKKKIALVTCFIGLLGGVTALAVDGMRLRNQVDLLQDMVDDFETDELISEIITNQATLEIKREKSTEEIKKITTEFVEKLFSAPADETYGQVPAVQSYLTDAGIKTFMKEMDPERYAEVTSAQIHEIRSIQVPQNPDNSRLNIIQKNSYVELDKEVKQASVFYKAECNYDDGEKLPTCIISFELTLINSDEDGWKIDNISDFYQL